jgi:23S rRNA (guanine745-N1)-methyltransferase
MKKIDHYKKRINENINCLICPKCGERFSLSENTLLCGYGHRFDIAAKGYVNFMTGAKVAAEQYDATLFDSREIVFQNRFFDPLLFEMQNIILNYNEKPGLIADIGCGEGSALEWLTEKTGAAGIGLDLSKQGIGSAARRGLANVIWIVGDLTKLPLSDRSADVLINMLSPANYKEFDRTAKPNGMILKVLPGEHYLRELRTYFYKGGEKETYSNERMADAFKAHYPNYIEKELTYTAKTDAEFLFHLARMSPLASDKGIDAAEKFSQSGLQEITAEFKILASKIQTPQKTQT